MSIQACEFIFIILKPAAAKDKKLSELVKNELKVYGEIKYLKKNIIVKKDIIREHYKASESARWYPLITDYLSNKLVERFIIEPYWDKYYLDGKEIGFGEFLKSQVIGPADFRKTKKYHIRRLALKKLTFFVDNLIHSSDNANDALNEIRLWYQDEPNVVAEYEEKSLILNAVNSRGSFSDILV
jgi:nucleoside diphosphate kinase